MASQGHITIADPNNGNILRSSANSDEPDNKAPNAKRATVRKMKSKISVPNATPAQEGMWKIARRKEKRIAACKELIIHVIFDVTFITIIFLQRDVVSSYWMNYSLNSAIVSNAMPFNASTQPFAKTYLGLQTFNDVQYFFEEFLGPTVSLQGQWYSGRDYSGDDGYYIQYTNRRVGGIRIRQLRVRNGTCSIPDWFKGTTNFCYNQDYNSDTKDTSPFGPNGTYKYTDESQSGSAELWGYVGGVYEGGGYIVDIPLDQEAAPYFTQLVNDEWWDVGTRVIFVTMNFVNIEMDAHGSVLYLMMEIPASGIVVPSYVFKTFRLDLYVTPVDYFRGILEVLFLIILVYLIYYEVMEFKDLYVKGQAKKYISSLWNCLDIAGLLAFSVTACWYIAYLGSPGRNELNLSTFDYVPEFETVATMAVDMYNISAFNILLAAFRTFKFFRLNDRLFVIWKALKYASPDLFSFLVVFFIMFLAFTLMGWLTFGADTNFFNTFANAFGSCWNFVLGNPPDYSILIQSNRVLGPLFFMFFTVFCFFILINMFIAILNDAYDKVHVTKPAPNVKQEFSQNAKKFLKSLKESIQGKKIVTTLHLIENMDDASIFDKSEVTPEEMQQALGDKATEEHVVELLEIHKKLHAPVEVEDEGGLSSSSGLSTTSGVSRRSLLSGKSKLSADADAILEKLAAIEKELAQIKRKLP